MKATKIESGFQLLKRITTRPPLQKLHPVLFPENKIHPKKIIQITGESSVGKSILVMELLARCILPSTYKNKLLPGNDSGAIIINTDHHFNLLKLISLMKSFLNDFEATDATEIIENSLKNLMILNCYSSEQLKFTFQNLERILNENFNITLIVIDSLVAYYWYDRSITNIFSYNLYCVNLLSELKKVLSDRNVVTVFTKCETETNIRSLNNLISCSVYLKKESDYFTAIVYQHEDNTHFSKKYKINKCFQFFD